MDIKRTKLGIYKKDSAKYENLTIRFNSDATFVLNMDVPFIYDSIGKWGTSGNRIDEMNFIIFKRPGRTGRELEAQFTQLFTQDSVFYFNSMTPKKDSEAIQEIYFKKCK